MFRFFFSVFLLTIFSVFAAGQSPQIEIKSLPNSAFIHNSSNTCQSEEVLINVSSNLKNISQINLQVNGVNYYNIQSLKLNTDELLGAVPVIAEVVYKQKRRSDGCEVLCHAWSKTMLNVVPCKRTCPQIPKIKLNSSVAEFKENISFTIAAENVTSTSQLGELAYTWEVFGAKFQKLNETTILLTPDSRVTEIAVLARLSTNFPDCAAEDKLIIYREFQPLPPKQELGICELKTSRVDNKCKANLTEIVRRFTAGNGTKLIIRASDLKTLENLKKSLTTGELGVKLDPYKIELENFGTTKIQTFIMIF